MKTGRRYSSKSASTKNTIYHGISCVPNKWCTYTWIDGCRGFGTKVHLRRAQAVVKTGLIDAPNSDLFQIYCDLAKDLTGYEQAKFSLFDGESQCSMGAAGVDDSYEVGAKLNDQSGMFVLMFF